MDFFEQLKQHINENDTFGKSNRMQLTAVREGYAEAVMEITENSCNAVGTVQGGAIFTLADFAFAALTNSREKVTVAQQVSINYFSQPKGERMVATARYKKDGRSSCVVNVDVVDDTGCAIAQFVGTGFKLK